MTTNLKDDLIPLYGVVSYGRGTFTLYSRKGEEIVFCQDFDDGVLFGFDVPIVRLDLAKHQDVLRCVSEAESPFTLVQISVQDGLKMFEDFNIPVFRDGTPESRVLKQ